jgi:carboxyl-terminal processing protease
MRNLLMELLYSLGRAIKRLLNIGIQTKYVILICAAVGGVTYFRTHDTVVNEVGGKENFVESKRYVDIKNLIIENYIGPSDPKAMGDAAAQALVKSLYDEKSYYMSAEDYQAYQLNSANEYSDIGFSLVTDDSTGGFRVVTVFPGSPAALGGLQPNMVITAVDGQKLSGNYTTDDVRSMIRAKLNSKFVLEIDGGKNYIEVDCTNLNDTAVNSRLEKTGAAYIQIYNFEAGSGKQAVDAIEGLLKQGADSLVIDVRNNPGGLPEEIQILLDYLLPEGRIFSLKSSDGTVQVYESDSTCLHMNTVVLINTGTRREAEIFAAVLREWNWVTLLGEPTPGDTRMQETIPLQDGSAIRLSTKCYLTSTNVDIANKGVAPDIQIKNDDESATGTTEGTTGGEDGTASTSNDRQLMEALTLLS